MVGYLQFVRIYSFMKEIKVQIRASYIVFLLANTENNFIKEITHVEISVKFVRILEQVKPSTASRLFIDLL